MFPEENHGSSSRFGISTGLPSGLSAFPLSLTVMQQPSPIHDVTVVVGLRVADAVRRSNEAFHTIGGDSHAISQSHLDWSFRIFLRNNYDTQWLTALMFPFSLAFEWYAWRQLRRRIFAGEFDVVLRLLPMSRDIAQPLCLLPTQGTDTVCDRAAEWRSAICARL